MASKRQNLLSRDDEAFLISEIIAGTYDDDCRAYWAEKLLALHYEDQRAEQDSDRVIYKSFNYQS